MGGATTIAHVGACLYRVTYPYAHGNEDERITIIEDELLALAGRLVAKYSEIQTKEAELSGILSVLDTKIDDMNTCGQTPGCDYAAASEEVYEVLVVVKEGRLQIGFLYTEYLDMRAMELALIKEKAFIQNYAIDDKTEEIWCSQYYTSLSGSYAVAELSNHHKYGAVMLPLPYTCADHGMMSTVYNLEPAEVKRHPAHALHYALELGDKNWAPKYVGGTISNINYDTDKGNVALDVPGDYPQSRTLYNVPIAYMNCNAEAFYAGDHVLVKMNDHLGITDPSATVIGFVEHPRPCPKKLAFANGSSFGGSINGMYIDEVETHTCSGTICGAIIANESCVYTQAGEDGWSGTYPSQAYPGETHSFTLSRSWTQSTTMNITRSAEICPHRTAHSVYEDSRRGIVIFSGPISMTTADYHVSISGSIDNSTSIGFTNGSYGGFSKLITRTINYYCEATGQYSYTEYGSENNYSWVDPPGNTNNGVVNNWKTWTRVIGYNPLNDTETVDQTAFASGTNSGGSIPYTTSCGWSTPCNDEYVTYRRTYSSEPFSQAYTWAMDQPNFGNCP